MSYTIFQFHKEIVAVDYVIPPNPLSRLDCTMNSILIPILKDERYIKNKVPNNLVKRNCHHFKVVKINYKIQHFYEDFRKTSTEVIFVEILEITSHTYRKHGLYTNVRKYNILLGPSCHVRELCHSVMWQILCLSWMLRYLSVFVTKWNPITSVWMQRAYCKEFRSEFPQ